MPTRILRNDRPKGGLTQAGKRHDLKAVRWYVLTLPTAAGGRRDRISPQRLGRGAFPAGTSGRDSFRVFRPLVRGGTKGGWQAGQHEATFAVQLRVYPFFGRGNLPHEAGTPLV